MACNVLVSWLVINLCGYCSKIFPSYKGNLTCLQSLYCGKCQHPCRKLVLRGVTRRVHDMSLNLRNLSFSISHNVYDIRQSLWRVFIIDPISNSLIDTTMHNCNVVKHNTWREGYNLSMFCFVPRPCISNHLIIHW